VAAAVLDRPRAAAAGTVPVRARLRGYLTPVLFAGVLLLFGIAGWQRRWMSDDGLIVLRTVRQLLAGNGPVFNVGERVESSTSTVWTYLLVLPGLLGLRLEWAAVVLGLVASVAGLAFALDGARRLHRPAGGGVLLPAGALVVATLSPFRDFATSGLETGLVTCWLGASWWCLVRLAGVAPERRRRVWPQAVLIGLGPLVRPDLALMTVPALIALVILVRPRPARLAGLVAAAGLLPAGYEVFRAGYYGLLVPTTAITKEAGQHFWRRGWVYLLDLVDPYLLVVPLALALLAGLSPALLRRIRRVGRPAGPAATPARRGDLAVVVAVALVGALAMTLYVVRVGGDFMHARMLLPALWCLLLPVAAVPANVLSVPAVLGTAVWAGFALTGGLVAPHVPLWYGGLIADERIYWVRPDTPNPVLADDLAVPGLLVGRQVGQQAPGPSLIMLDPRPPGWWAWPLRPDERTTFPWLNLGMAGMTMPLDMRVEDTVGLSDPLAAHTLPIPGARVGHEKLLPMEWYPARWGEPEMTGPGDPDKIAAARYALRCPAVTEMLDSVTAPLSPARFWDNLVGAAARDGMRLDRDPTVAARCGASPTGPGRRTR
jgi:arabinofuranosyltransferase